MKKKSLDLEMGICFCDTTVRYTRRGSGLGAVVLADGCMVERERRTGADRLILIRVCLLLSFRQSTYDPDPVDPIVIRPT